MDRARSTPGLSHRLLRPLATTDSTAAITQLLHRAYAPLGAAGMNFTAVDQSEAVTRERMARGQCFVVVQGDVVLGTVTVNGPFNPKQDAWARATPWFYRPDVAHLHQLAVDPSLHGQGVGRQLLAACEAWALAQGHDYLALDTAMPATHLRQLYQRAGFVDVDEVQWDGKTYRSVIMAKRLVA